MWTCLEFYSSGKAGRTFFYSFTQNPAAPKIMQHGSWHQATIITKEAKHQQELRVGMLSNWRHLQWIRMKIACMIQERETFDSPKRLGSTDMGPRMEQESSRNELNNLFQFLSLALHHQIRVSSHSRKEKPPGRAHVIWAPVEDTWKSQKTSQYIKFHPNYILLRYYLYSIKGTNGQWRPSLLDLLSHSACCQSSLSSGLLQWISFLARIAHTHVWIYTLSLFFCISRYTWCSFWKNCGFTLEKLFIYYY